jgi:hypothetical protein
MLLLRDFLNKEYLAQRQQTFDECRVILKKFGKPKNDYDLWMLEHYRYEAALAKYDLTEFKDRKELPQFNFSKALPDKEYSDLMWHRAFNHEDYFIL